MAGFGFGFGSQVSGIRRMPVAPALLFPMIRPGRTWNGTPGSGFAQVPQNPVRLTAKPTLRLLTPPNQCFTDELTIGVIGGAANQGSLLEGMGLTKVIVHFEGAQHEIHSPMFHTIEDANGLPRAYFGWWLTLKHAGLSGGADLYFEAVPADPTMQNRVIGPYRYLLADTIHDAEIQVARSQPEIPGVRFNSLTKALGYVHDQRFDNPRIQVLEAGTYRCDTTKWPPFVPQGYVRIEGAVPGVVIGGSNENISDHRPRIDRLHFRGANITFDGQFMSELYNEGLGDHWLDGVTLTNSAGKILWFKRARPKSTFVRNTAWFTECTVSNLQDPLNGSALIRGCSISNGFSDCLSNSNCVVGNHTHDWGAQEFNVDIPALTVSYTGPAATATLESNNENNRTFTARYGGTVATFTTNTERNGTRYNVSDVVNWLNSLPGWSAILLDNTRHAAQLGLTGGGALPQTNVKDTSVTLTTAFDFHSDWYQQKNDAYRENHVIAFNMVTDFRGQHLFINETGTVADWLVFNNAFQGSASHNSALSKGPKNNLVIVHNSWADQPLHLRFDNGLQLDGYCVVSNNVAEGIQAFGTTASPSRVSANHVFSGGSPPAWSTGTSVGGSGLSLFVDAANGDFAPAGALLANLKVPVVPCDRTGNVHGPFAVAGSEAYVIPPVELP